VSSRSAGQRTVTVPFTLPLGSFSEFVVATKPPSSAAIFWICRSEESKPSTSKVISPLRMILRTC
jgi:hypothetical protein